MNTKDFLVSYFGTSPEYHYIIAKSADADDYVDVELDGNIRLKVITHSVSQQGRTLSVKYQVMHRFETVVVVNTIEEKIDE